MNILAIQHDVDLTSFNTFGVAARARSYAEIHSIEQLRTMLQSRTQTEPLLILGGGSNLLLTQDFSGLALHIKLFGTRVVKEEPDATYVDAAAGENWHDFVRWTLDQGLTGVHRKDVKRLSELLETDAPPQENVTLGAQLVAKWVGQAPYIDKGGHPVPLNRGVKDGGEKSFEALVASVSKDIRSRAILDEWLRLGVVHIDNNDCVCLNTEAFVPKQGFAEKAYYFQHNLHDHIAASVHNMVETGPPFVERSVHYDTLTKASAAELASLGEALGMQALQTVNRRALALEKKDAPHPDANQRINFGIYFYHTKQNDSHSEPTDGDAESPSNT